MRKTEAGPSGPATALHPQYPAPASRPRYRSSWGVDRATARKFGYPMRRESVLEELERRVEALERDAAIRDGLDLVGGAE